MDRAVGLYKSGVLFFCPAAGQIVRKTGILIVWERGIKSGTRER